MATECRRSLRRTNRERLWNDTRGPPNKVCKVRGSGNSLEGVDRQKLESIRGRSRKERGEERLGSGCHTREVEKEVEDGHFELDSVVKEGEMTEAGSPSKVGVFLEGSCATRESSETGGVSDPCRVLCVRQKRRSGRYVRNGGI